MKAKKINCANNALMNNELLIKCMDAVNYRCQQGAAGALRLPEIRAGPIPTKKKK